MRVGDRDGGERGKRWVWEGCRCEQGGRRQKQRWGAVGGLGGGRKEEGKIETGMWWESKGKRRRLMGNEDGWKVGVRGNG